MLAIGCLTGALATGIEPEMRVLAVFSLVCILVQACYSVYLLRGVMAGQIQAWHERCLCYEIVTRRMERYQVPRIKKLKQEHIDKLLEPLKKSDGSFEETEKER